MTKDYNAKKIAAAVSETAEHFTNAPITTSYAKELVPFAAWNGSARRKLIDKTYRSAWWVRRRGSDISYLPDSTLNRIVDNTSTGIDLAHAFAHEMTGTVCNGITISREPSLEPHGVEFVQNYLEIVEHLFGKVVKRELKKNLVAHKVKTYRKSAEARQKQSERWVLQHVPKAKESLVGIISQLESL